MDQRDLALEYITHLDFPSIRNLCKSNTFYRNFCKTPQAQKIINDRYIKYRVDKELPNITRNREIENITYRLSDTHSININRYSSDIFNVSEYISDMDSYYQRRQRSTNDEIDESSKQSILLNLFTTDVQVDFDRGSLSTVYTIRFSKEPYGPSDSLQNLLRIVLEEIFRRGNPIIERKNRPIRPIYPPHRPDRFPSPFAPNPFAPSPYAPNPFAPNPYAPSPYAPNPFAPNPYAPPGFFNPFKPYGPRIPFTYFTSSTSPASPAIPAIRENNETSLRKSY